MISVIPAKAGIECKKAGKPPMIHLYPGTPHAFHADYCSSYRKDQAADGWQRATEWFKRHLGLSVTSDE